MIWIIIGFHLFQMTWSQCTNTTCPSPTADCRERKDNSTYCICYAGFRGRDCSIDLDECRMGRPCRTTGLCVNTVGSYTCKCLGGWQGDHCEDRDNSTVPECINGWKGPNCTDDVNECMELAVSPCQPHGTCINKNGTYHCACHPGWTGPNCTRDIDECSSRPCDNGGTCSNTAGSYSCACASPWYGTSCNTTQCSNAPCLNGGTCINVGTVTYSCDCRAPWGGNNCEINTTCTSNPCYNIGRCSNLTGAFVCDCVAPWGGELCNVNMTLPAAGSQDETSSANLALILGGCVGGVVCIWAAVAGTIAVWWWFTRYHAAAKVVPKGSHTVIEVHQETSTSDGCEEAQDLPRKRAELDDGTNVHLGVPPASGYGTRDIVVKTRFSMTQSRN